MKTPFIISIINNVFTIYTFMLMIRIIGSWVPEWQNSRFMQFISFYTDPYLNLFRRIIPPLGMIDISPIFAFLALSLIQYGLIALIATLFL